MKDKGGCAGVSRRDAIRLIAVTPASGAALAGGYPFAAATEIAARRADAADAARNAAALGRGPEPSLAKLAAEHFEPLIGETFTIGGHEATLAEVRRGPSSGPKFRRQFALAFTARREVPIDADTLPVSHPAIGRHDVHVTEIGCGAGRKRLEICFS